MVVRMQRRTQCFGAIATGLRNAHCVRPLCGTVLETVALGPGFDLSHQHALRLRREHLRSEEHTSELQSLMRISYAVFCLKKKKYKDITPIDITYYDNYSKTNETTT